MENTSQSYPDSIRRLEEGDLPALQDKFCAIGTDARAQINYKRLSAMIAINTGHEFACNDDGTPYDRAQWEAAFSKSLHLLNRELMLGLDRDIIEILTLCYTVLQKTTRYGGENNISPEAGENTGVHSLHTLLQAQHIFQTILENHPEFKTDIEFFRALQKTCLMMLVHDLGEMLGEAGSLAAAAEAGNFDVKEKTEFERNVFRFAVRLAVQNVTDRRPKHEFYDAIDRVRSLVKVQNQGSDKSDADMVAELLRHCGAPAPLNAGGGAIFDFLYQCWECVEEPEKSGDPFIGNLATACERLQGLRHLNRHLKTALVPGGAAPVPMAAFAPGYKIVTNGEYSEMKLAALCVVATGKTREIIAQHALARIYGSLIEFYQSVSPAFFLDPAIRETRAHKDGSIYAPSEIDIRHREIDAARIVAAMESDAARRCAGMAGSFNKATLFTGWTAISREQTVALYSKAIESKYFPKLIVRDGKKTGEVLVRDLPRGLTGNAVLSLPEKEAVARQVRDFLREKELLPL